ncbi:MAG: efflux RND transporter periplasmic adaptor subunit [Planctomycetota bacterium]|nr:efflux RND transporter periplasmic adaptor subunit [Planctomycetota bacterium]
MDAPENTKKTGWQRVLFLLKVLEIRLRFVAILVITALAVGYWDNIVNYWERWTRGPYAGQEQAQSEIEYTCGMHPWVKRDKPGKCPICGMDLIQRQKGAATALPEGTLARVQISPERIMQAGVQVEPVSHRMLSRMALSYGVVELDETRVARITLRFPGRVEELLVNAVGMEVKKGDPLVKVYSPKFLAAEQEYVNALAAQRKVEADPQAGADAKSFAASLAVSARRPLALAGFTSEQLAALERGEKPSDRITFYSPLAGVVLEKNVLLGDTLEEGMTLYTVADLSTLWVQAQIAEADLSITKLGMPVEVTAVAWPDTIFYGNVDLLYPTLNTESRTVKARVAVANREGKLKPGMFVTAAIRAPLGRFGVIGGPDDPLKGAAPPSPAPAAKEVYTCPMHPEVITDKPGDCPKCGMHLVKKEAPSTAAGPGIWAEGYACAMHPDMLQPEGGVCKICGCGMQTVKWRVEKLLSIPETAIIDTGTRQIVYVEAMPGVYDARAVKLGIRAGRYYPVLSGLTVNDRVVTHGSFLIDAEARLNPAASAGAAPSAEAAQGHPHDH